MSKTTKVFDQSKNGVKVLVTKHFDAEGLLGSTVETDCSCFGLPGRVHSNYGCPNFICEEKIAEIMET